MHDAMKGKSWNLCLLVGEAEHVRGIARGVQLQKQGVVVGGG